MKVTMINSDDFFEGATPEEIVHQMNLAAWTQSDGDQVYMADVASRVSLQTGIVIRTDTAENFLADLVKAKLITIEGD